MEIKTGHVDRSTYRRALGAFASGVGVVTTLDTEGRPVGMTATSFTALSFDPASVLVCVKRDSRTHELIGASRRFAVNLLEAGSADIASYCATPGGDKTLPQDWLERTNSFGAPALHDAIAVVDCAVTDLFESGTHSIIVGEVTAVGLASHRRSVDPLIHYRGAFRHLNTHLAQGTVAPLPIHTQDILITEAM